MIGGQTRNPCFAPGLHPNSGSAKVFQRKFQMVNSSEFGVLLQSCIDSRSLKQGRALHVKIREAGLERNPVLLPKLLKFYCVCGRADNAREVFDSIPKRNLDTFSWTAMITGYVRNETPHQAIKLFCEMLEHGLELDSYTFSASLKASTDLNLRLLSTNLHSLIMKCGFGSFLSVGNALIHAYGSFGDACSAQKVFGRMSNRDVVSWSSMIRASSSAKHFTESATLFSRMQFEEFIRPNEITLVSLLPACSFFSSLRKGQSIHAYAIRNRFDSNLIVCSALVTMYSRCGNPDEAFKVFSSMEKPNVFVWTSMIEGFSINGRFELALELFKEMQGQGLKLNPFTLIVVLSACSHGGLVDMGLEIFESMKERFGFEPCAEHYACIVDMLGRGGRLNEAENLIERMEVPPTGSVLGSLLGACQVHCNVKLGEKLAMKLFRLEPYNETNYVILSNIYASAGRWDDVGRVRRLMAVKGLSKRSGCSWIEIKNKVYVFGAHDQSNSESESIYRKLEELNYMIIKAGYVPSTKCVLLDVEEDDKKRLLRSHSERLAIAFGLLKAPPNVPIRISKNLRICGDCHDAIKLISKVVARQFVIRDTRRFHHFSEGTCSCGDYCYLICWTWWIWNLIAPAARVFSGNVDRLMEIIKQAAKEGALVLYTLANPSMAESAKQACKLWGDDGALLQNLNRAHIVLVGVSRTGKTPLSIYLAQKGYKVANAPIIMGVDSPKSLFDINQEKIFGLTINPAVLQTIRKATAKTLGLKGDMMSNYSDMEHVREELEIAKRVFAQNPVWPVIEITGKAIEETAAVIVRIYHDRKKKCFLPHISKRY
ncbi:hypothetical protein IEQ34_011692 [Dendrobium chrysotoxum]|uniref:DYW domain-containing protein n=1 Tax=Dendrobium chrysotoxum TaxID=161865 RepID=A0AAV7GT60_DENCH|nr:hypothetical protein IEQ34_011692 [Dendrobium chrysotoxum]